MEETKPTVTKVEYVSSCIGMQYRPKSIMRMLMDDADFMKRLTIVPEPCNKYDPNAVSVCYKNVVIGYIPREETDQAREYLQFLRGFSQVQETWEVTEAKFMSDNETPQWFAFVVKAECIL